MPNFIKIHPARAEFFHAAGQMERQAYMTKLTVTFFNFANAPKYYVLEDRVYLILSLRPTLIEALKQR
jgi:hypothetical protein